MADGGDWRLIGLDEKMARRQGMPARLPVPAAEFEGLADKGLEVDTVRRWIKDFLTNSEPGKSGTWRKQNAQVVAALEAFLDKAPLWDKAQKAFAAGEWDKALSSLKRITVMDADDHAARLNLASAQANVGDHAAALKGFKAIGATFAGDADYHVAFGQVHLALGDRDAALDQMVLALEAKPDCQPALDAMEKLGVLVAVYENPRDAASLTYVRADSVLAYLGEQWKSEPRDAAFYLEQLGYHERERRFDVVLAAAEATLGAAPDASGRERAGAARVSALRALGRADEALSAARAFAAESPRSAAARVELSRCLAATGKAEDAAAEVAAALQAEPGDQ
ncbi:MAG: tetratricopeptide repeat protein, partial [Polyangiaceae bacterium]